MPDNTNIVNLYAIGTHCLYLKDASPKREHHFDVF